ncbi:MAG TPA: pyridoxamine 5'-phosphate oxidase [Jiangellaceae bacterium]|nr:pyridoxamine 5'-phosphate oxidase [Jiangellaceae bacterium]
MEPSPVWHFAQETLARMRRNYPAERLLESALADEPFMVFRSWLAAAIDCGLPEPNAMALATATPDGRPRARHVLLKELDDSGFVFFTNLGSRKAADISVNPAVSLCFPWFAMARQVVVTGTAEPVTRAETEAYWVTRPRESQLSAWASDQSSVIGSRAELEAAAEAAAERFPEAVPVPPFWGGYRVVPDTVEFWQGGPARLHDRLRYQRTDGGWRLERLAP